MAAYLFVFVFFTIGIKLVLGLWFIYLLLPGNGLCPNCDHATISVADLRGVGWLARLCRVQRRWCIGCGRPHLARRGRRLTLSVLHETGPEAAPQGRNAPGSPLQ